MGSPFMRILDTPLTHGEEYLLVLSHESFGHGWVSLLGGSTVMVAIVVFQVVDIPLCVGSGVDFFESHGTRSTLAGLVSRI